MKAIILAAGRGTRLRPITDEKPKPLLEIGGKPLIGYSIEGLISCGIRDIAIVVGYLKDQITDYVKRTYDANFVFIEQPSVTGTAAAVLLGADFLTTDFIMLYGDTFLSEGAINKIALSAGDGAVGAVKSLTPEKFGCISVDEHGFVESIIEKPQVARSNLVVMGGYRFPLSVLKYLRLIKPSKRGELELPDAVRLSIESGARYVVARIDGSDDVATLKDLERLNTTTERNQLAS
jgi:dTDP-glucose pyrophosphorylase